MPPRNPRSTVDTDEATASNGDGYTVAVGPPPQKQRSRFSMWEALFDECRAFQGEWRRTAQPLSKSTAAQLSSDIRNAYKRDFVKSRLRGLSSDEKWDAAWGEGDGDEAGQFYVWIKYEGKRSTND